MDTAKFKSAIVYTIYIASTPEKVWQALTSAEFTRQYFSGQSICGLEAPSSCAARMERCTFQAR